MNIKDIARIAETSTATISRVINGDPKVAESTRQRVLRIIKENNFVLNANSRNLRTKKSSKILVIIPTIVNSFYSRILQGIEAKAEESGYDVLIAITNLDDAKERKYLEMLRAKEVDGCISLFSLLDVNEISDLADKYPFVQCSEATLGANISNVSIDNRQAIYDVTKYFIKQGHKNIAMITGDYYKFSELWREKGYREALHDNKMVIREELIVKSFYRYKDGFEAIEKLLKLDNPPTAVICASDSLAIGAVNGAIKNGKKVGEDISIIGFDNTSITSNYVPTISTIAQPRFDLGTAAFELLSEKLNDNNSLTKKVILPHTIIHRESTKYSK